MTCIEKGIETCNGLNDWMNDLWCDNCSKLMNAMWQSDSDLDHLTLDEGKKKYPCLTNGYQNDEIHPDSLPIIFDDPEGERIKMKKALQGHCKHCEETTQWLSFQDDNNGIVYVCAVCRNPVD